MTSFCEVNEVNYRIMRIANVYGHDKTISSKKNVLGFLSQLMKEDKDITLYNNGDDLRDYMHIIDICRALKTVIDKGEVNTIYNIASGESLPFRKILEIVKDKLNSRSKFISIPTPRFNQLSIPKNFSLNVSKLKSLGFVPSINLHEGLQNFCK